MKCLIIEDDKVAQMLLERCVNEIPFLNIVGIYDNAEQAITEKAFEKVDIVFLDIELPGISGIELLKSKPLDANIIIISSKKEYAFDAFEVNVTDYLQKPINFERLKAAINRVIEINGNVVKDNLSEKHVFIKVDSNLVRIEYNKLDYIEALGDYVRVITTDKKYTILSTMKALESKLPSQFIRIHKSFIVNKNKITRIEGNSIPFDTKLLPISKSYKESLIKQLNLI